MLSAFKKKKKPEKKKCRIVTLYENIKYPVTALLKSNRWFCPHDDCKSINRSYKSRQSLRNHYLIHTEKRVECPFIGCNKYFPYQRMLDQHIRTHTKEKPYKCSFKGCNKTFAQAGSRTRHERILLVP